MNHSQTKILNVFFALLQTIFTCNNTSPKELNSFSEEDWKELFRISAQQGVLAIVYDIISSLPEKIDIPRNINIQWAISCDAIENRYTLQHKVSAQLADIFDKQGITTVVMKGLAIGTYYPRPEHRECGDLDCYLGAKHELGNQICEQNGATVNRNYYKDSTIKYRGLMVENHRYFLPIRGSRTMKELERHLENIAISDTMTFIPNTKLVIPSPDFNALFLTMHGLNHFLSEGIKIRHILDWALLLKAEQNNINWKEFYYWADKMNMTRFANALTAISIKYFNLQITNSDIQTSSISVNRVLEDTLFKNDGIHNKGYSPWKSRFMLIKNKLTSVWKYHKIYQKSVLVELTKSIFAFIFERNPKL